MSDRKDSNHLINNNIDENIYSEDFQYFCKIYFDYQGKCVIIVLLLLKISIYACIESFEQKHHF